MKKIKTLSFVLIIFTLVFAFSFSAFAKKDKDEVGKRFNFKDLTYTVLENGSIKVLKYKGDDKSYTIPSKIDGKNVTAIGSMAFNSCTELQNLTIPGTVNKIEDYAVSYCPKLKTLTIKEGKLKKLQSLYFYCCRGLKTVKLPKNISSMEFFFDCSDLKNVIIDSENPNLRSYDGVVYSKNLKKLIYYPQGKEDRYFIVPSDVDNILKNSFYGAKNLKGIYIPKSVKTIGETAFAFTAVTLYYEGASIPEKFEPAMLPWEVLTGASPLEKVELTKISGNSNSITLKWNKVEGATGYRIYLYNEEEKEYEAVGNSSKNNFTIKKLESATNYKFAVKPYAKTVSGLTWGKFLTKDSFKTAPAVPYFSLIGGEDKVTFNIGETEGAVGYVIYYSTEKDGTYKKLAGTKKEEYTKKKLKSGETYYFKVRAYNKNGGENTYSAFSSIKAVTVK